MRGALLALVGFVAGVAVALLAHDTLFPTWTGYYYSDGADLSRYVRSEPGEVTSLEECQVWVRKKNAADYLETKKTAAFGYECGKNCRFEPSLGISVCKETLK